MVDIDDAFYIATLADTHGRPYHLGAGRNTPEVSTASVVREEIFGPCCHIQPFDTEEEAVHMANDTPYGLATSIYTQDIGRASRLAAQVDVGLCWINSWFLRDLRTPFGGSKQSGIGREGGVHSLEFYTELHNVMVKY
jgi:aminomuconate-semialdehyde/2-hydroxymuconate-6-semialdehyde dehydrogenase